MWELEPFYRFRCSVCNEVTKIPHPSKDGSCFTSKCPCRVQVKWTGSDYMVVDQKKSPKHYNPFFLRFVFGGERYNHNFYWSKWAWPLRMVASIYSRFILWRNVEFGFSLSLRQFTNPNLAIARNSGSNVKAHSPKKKEIQEHVGTAEESITPDHQ